MRGLRREGEAETERSQPPRRAQPSQAEQSRGEHLPLPPPRAPGARPQPAPAPCRGPNLPTMPYTPPAPATPQPRSAPSARSRRAAAPTMQVSERDPHAPTRGESGPALPSSAPFASCPSRRGPSPGTRPPASQRPFPEGLSIPLRSWLAPALPGAAVPVPAAASIQPRLGGRLRAVSCLGSPVRSRRSLPRSPFADLLFFVSPDSRHSPALCGECGPAGWVGWGPRWGWGPAPAPRGSRPTPSSSPAHNRSVRSWERGGGGAPARGLRASWRGRLKLCGAQGLGWRWLGGMHRRSGDSLGVSWPQMHLGALLRFTGSLYAPRSLPLAFFPSPLSLLPTMPLSLCLSVSPYPFTFGGAIPNSSIFAAPASFPSPFLMSFFLQHLCSLLSHFLSPHPGLFLLFSHSLTLHSSGCPAWTALSFSSCPFFPCTCDPFILSVSPP